EKRLRSLEDNDAQAVLHAVHSHLPVASVRCSVVVAIVDEGFEVEMQRARGADERVLNKRSICPGLHEDAFFELRVGTCERPDRTVALQPEPLKMDVPLRADRSVHPTS